MNILAELLSSGARAEIFRLLFGSVGRELHMREIERQSGYADATVRQELRRLLRLGLIVSRQDGNRVCYRACEAHPIYPEIRSLVRKTSGLVESLSEALRIPEIRIAFIFGSVAAGSERAESDIDLLVIGDTTLRQVGKRLSDISREVGREINPHVFTIEEFRKRKSGDDHFVSAVLKGPRLFLRGGEDELDSMGGERMVAATSKQQNGD